MTGDVIAPGPARSVSVRAAVVAFVVDVGLVLLFAAIGRRSHAESGAVVGVLRTAWPFLAGLILGWVVALGWRRTAPLRVRDAVPVWLLTVAGGMLLRAATGAGTALSFVVVATVVLGVFLLGWRALAALVRRRASR